MNAEQVWHLSRRGHDQYLVCRRLKSNQGSPILSVLRPCCVSGPVGGHIFSVHGEQLEFRCLRILRVGKGPSVASTSSHDVQSSWHSEALPPRYRPLPNSAHPPPRLSAYNRGSAHLQLEPTNLRKLWGLLCLQDVNGKNSALKVGDSSRK